MPLDDAMLQRLHEVYPALRDLPAALSAAMQQDARLAALPAGALLFQPGHAVALPPALALRLLDAHAPFRALVFGQFSQRLQTLMAVVDAVAFHRLDERLTEWLLTRGPRLAWVGPGDLGHRHPAWVRRCLAHPSRGARVMKSNVGSLDRIIRATAGAGLIAWAAFGGPVWAWVGVVPLLTAAFGFCPAYTLFGISSCRVRS